MQKKVFTLPTADDTSGVLADSSSTQTLYWIQHNKLESHPIQWNLAKSLGPEGA